MSLVFHVNLLFLFLPPDNISFLLPKEPEDPYKYFGLLLLPRCHFPFLPNEASRQKMVDAVTLIFLFVGSLFFCFLVSFFSCMFPATVRKED